MAAFPEFSESKLHNPVLAYENGEEFLKDFYLGAEGQLDPFILIIEGSIPNELNKSEGYWASMGIGEVKVEPQGIVSMVTGFGGTRIVDMLAGEQLPRIC